MSTFNKEKILAELRAYHTNSFPAESPNKEAGSLQLEIEAKADEITNMLLKLIGGKAEFADFSDSLNLVRAKVSAWPADVKGSNAKEIFLSKIDQLLVMLVIAKESVFKLKPVRMAKVV